MTIYPKLIVKILEKKNKALNKHDQHRCNLRCRTGRSCKVEPLLFLQALQGPHLLCLMGLKKNQDVLIIKLF